MAGYWRRRYAPVWAALVLLQEEHTQLERFIIQLKQHVLMTITLTVLCAKNVTGEGYVEICAYKENEIISKIPVLVVLDMPLDKNHDKIRQINPEESEGLTTKMMSALKKLKIDLPGLRDKSKLEGEIKKLIKDFNSKFKLKNKNRLKKIEIDENALPNLTTAISKIEKKYLISIELKTED
ncbi:MAG: hypothetical protein ABIH76_08265 [Candidatus Bathyarchaeota archaeon]